MITLDGSQGEGGGQIVRSAVSLSSITGQPVMIENIRAGRKPRGLRPQHVTAIRAAADICGAAIDGVNIDSDRSRSNRAGQSRPGIMNGRWAQPARRRSSCKR